MERARRPAQRALAALALSLAACSEAPREKLSAILITLDTTRADALSCYGTRTGTTPALDALARESTLYERAFTPAPITLAAHASILTGLYPPRHGLRDNGIGALSGDARTLAEAAHEAGAETAAFVGAVVLDRAFGLDQGFDVYDGPPARRTSGHPGERSAREVIDAALHWLDGRDPARPFFLWIHLYDAHAPYTPQHVAARASELERYLGEVREMDAELGRLFTKLHEDGTLAHALLVVTADHGEAFGEHQELTHGPFCWNTTLHVPLLVRHPDGSRAGERSMERVSTVDLAPTLAEALGARLGADVDGRSLATPVPAERGLYFESYAGFLAFGWSPLAGWLDQHGKYLHSSRPQFFEPESDPGEEHDLLAERAAELERYRRALAEIAERPALRGGGPIGAELHDSVQDLGYAAFDGTDGEFPDPLAPSTRPSPNDRVAAWRESMRAQEDMNQGRHAAAAETLQRLLAEDAGNPFLRSQLASCLMRLKRWAEALDALTPLLQSARAQPQVWYKLGVCQLRLGKREEAIVSLARAAELAPSEPRYREKLEEARSGASPRKGDGDDGG